MGAKFLKGLVLISILLVSVSGYSQNRKNPNYPAYKVSSPIERPYAWYDSVLRIPSGPVPELRENGWGTHGAAVFYCTTDSSLYMYTGAQWLKVEASGSGGSIDTSHLSERINQKLNSSDTSNHWIRRIEKNVGGDSIVFWIGSARYSIKDVSGGGSSDLTGVRDSINSLYDSVATAKTLENGSGPYDLLYTKSGTSAGIKGFQGGTNITLDSSTAGRIIINSTSSGGHEVGDSVKRSYDSLAVHRAEINANRPPSLAGIRDTVAGKQNYIRPLGTLVNDSVWASTSDSIAINGATASITSGKIQISGGAGSFSQSVDISKTLKGTNGNTNLEYYSMTVKGKVTVTGNGFGIGVRSNNATGGGNDALGRINTSGGNMYINGAGGTQLATSAGVSVSANDYLLMTFERELANVRFTVQNLTQGTDPVTLTFSYNVPTDAPQNNGRFAIFSFGGTMIVDSVAITSKSRVNTDLLLMCDSKYVYNAPYGQGWSQLLKNDVETVVSAGGSEGSLEWWNRLGEMLLHHPKQVLIGHPSNDARTGVNTDSTKARIYRIERAFRDQGAEVYFLNGFYETNVTPTAWIAYLATAKSKDSVINTYDPTHVAGALDADGIHPTVFGHKIIYNTIMASGKLKYLKNTGKTIDDESFIKNQTSSTQSAGMNISGKAYIKNDVEVGSGTTSNIAFRVKTESDKNYRVFGSSGELNLEHMNDVRDTYYPIRMSGSMLYLQSGGGLSMTLDLNHDVTFARKILGGANLPGEVAFRWKGATQNDILYFNDGTDNNFGFADDALSLGKPGNLFGSSLKLKTFNSSGVFTTVVDINSSNDIKFPLLTASLPLKLDASKNVTAAAIDLSSSEVTGVLPAANGGGSSGTYTPTITNIANVDASTMYPCQWSRIGNTVIVSGQIDIDPTTAAQTQLSFTLPVASNFTQPYQCGGTLSTYYASKESGPIYASVAADAALIVFYTTATSSTTYTFIFQYQIL